MKIIVAIAVTFFATNALADIIITSPMTIVGEYIVGVINNTGPLNDPASEMIAAQKLLDMDNGQIDGLYQTNTDDDYNDILVGIPFKLEADNANFTLTISGYDYVMAKYDGKNAGYVLFSTGGGQTITIPEFPTSFWTTDPAQWGISHWTAFNADPGNQVPEPATMLLFGTGLAGLAGFARRKRS